MNHKLDCVEGGRPAHDSERSLNFEEAINASCKKSLSSSKITRVFDRGLVMTTIYVRSIGEEFGFQPQTFAAYDWSEVEKKLKKLFREEFRKPSKVVEWCYYTEDQYEDYADDDEEDYSGGTEWLRGLRVEAFEAEGSPIGVMVGDDEDVYTIEASLSPFTD